MGNLAPCGMGSSWLPRQQYENVQLMDLCLWKKSRKNINELWFLAAPNLPLK
jgi:hypothetical protein